MLLTLSAIDDRRLAHAAFLLGCADAADDSGRTDSSKRYLTLASATEPSALFLRSRWEQGVASIDAVDPIDAVAARGPAACVGERPLGVLERCTEHAIDACGAGSLSQGQGLSQNALARFTFVALLERWRARIPTNREIRLIRDDVVQDAARGAVAVHASFDPAEDPFHIVLRRRLFLGHHDWAAG